MSMRAGTRSVRLIYALATASGALVATALALIALSRDAPLPDAWGFRGYGLLQAVAFTAVGMLIALRQRTNIIGWLLLYAGVISATGAFGLAFSVLPLAVAGVASAVLPDKAGQVLSIFLQLFVPIAIAIAILRHRLYDIDVLIRRTLIYVALSAVLIAAYVAAVGSLQALLAPFTSGNGVAVAISTLAVVALFQPVRSRIQQAIDRRFYRSKYDAERTLDAFAARLREHIDLGALEGELLAVVDETMQPVRASVWLRPSITP